MRRMPPLRLVLALSGVLSLVLACGSELDDVSDDNGGGGDAAESGEDGEWPETIMYGLLPTDDSDHLAAVYTPFEEYMTDCLDHPFELFPGTDYTAMIEAMRAGNLHISKFGPFAYILADERAGAETLVMPVEDPDEPTYRSLIVALESSGIEGLDGLEGETFAFVDPASTSGHLFPRALMVEQLGIDNEEIEDWLGEVTFSGQHDASIVSVLNEDVTAAAISDNTWKSRVEGGDFDDHENGDELTVVTETDDIPRTVEAVHEDLPEDLKEQVQTCYEDAIDDPDMESFFHEETNIPGGYIPVSDGDYDVVRDAADRLQMSPAELLEDEG